MDVIRELIANLKNLSDEDLAALSDKIGAQAKSYSDDDNSPETVSAITELADALAAIGLSRI